MQVTILIDNRALLQIFTTKLQENEKLIQTLMGNKQIKDLLCIFSMFPYFLSRFQPMLCYPNVGCKGFANTKSAILKTKVYLICVCNSQ